MVLILAILSLKHGWLAWLYYDINDNRYPVLIIYKWGFFFFKTSNVRRVLFELQCTTAAHPFYSFLLHFYYIKKKMRKSFAINLSLSLYVHRHVCNYAITIYFDCGLFSFKFVSLLSCSYRVYLLSFLMQLMLMRVQPWNQRLLKRQLILRKLSE